MDYGIDSSVFADGLGSPPRLDLTLAEVSGRRVGLEDLYKIHATDPSLVFWDAGVGSLDAAELLGDTVDSGTAARVAGLSEACVLADPRFLSVETTVRAGAEVGLSCSALGRGEAEPVQVVLSTGGGEVSLVL